MNASTTERFTDAPARSFDSGEYACAQDDIWRLSRERLVGHFRGGQVDAERGAFAHFRLHFDPAAVMLDDLFADRQPQPRAFRFALFGRPLGCEERLENFWKKLLRNAGAGVDHLDS